MSLSDYIRIAWIRGFVMGFHWGGDNPGYTTDDAQKIAEESWDIANENKN